MLFVSMILIIMGVSLVSAADTLSEPDLSELSTSNVEITMGNGVATVEQQEFVIRAIKASNLPNKEKKELIKNLLDIMENKSVLSESEQEHVIIKAAPIVFEYYQIDIPPSGDGSEITPQWTGVAGQYAHYTHNDLNEIAGLKMGTLPYYATILNQEASIPDTWGIGQMIQHYSWGGAPGRSKYWADEARRVLPTDAYNAYRYLGWSMHFMSDSGNPWHTRQLWEQANHNAYEATFVGGFWTSGHNFQSTIQNTPNYWYYYITNPETSANSLASLSSSYFTYINTMIDQHPDHWMNDPTVISYTNTVLKESLRYDEGLVDYVTR